MMYGGDDVGALVLDVGSSTTKAGYAGEDCPKAVFNSVVGIGDEKYESSSKQEASSSSSSSSSSHSHSQGGKKYFVGQDFGFRRDHVEAVFPVKHGLVENWDAVEKLWEHAFLKVLEVDPSQHPVLVAEPSFNPNDKREQLVQHMFERFKVPAMFVCKDAVLAAFSMGRSTALVVDSGGGFTSTVPVHDGYALIRGIRRTRLAGDYLTEALEKSVSSQMQGSIKPLYTIKTKSQPNKTPTKIEQTFPNTTASYHRFWQLDVVRDLKETRCEIAPSAKYKPPSSQKPEPYELPDGQIVHIGDDRLGLTETLFAPYHENMEDDLDPNFSFQGLPKMISDTVSSTDADIRRDLYASLILCGGNTRFRGFQKRLSHEILEFLPPAFKLKITAPNTPIEKRFAVWIGGSILGSLGSFQQLWISKAEYEEHGANIVQRRCP